MINNKMLNEKHSSFELNGATSIILYAIIGLVASGTTISGGMSPINVAVVTFSSFLGGLSCFTTSLISYIFNANITMALPQICSMIAILILKIIIGDKNSLTSRPVGASILTGIIMIFFGVTMDMFGELSLKQLILNIVMGALCGCTVYFIATASRIINNEKKIPITGAAGASLGVIYVLTLATLTSIDIFYVNIGRVLGIIIVLLGIRKYKHLGGAVCGVLASCGVIMCSPTLGRSTMLLACAGLIAGLFAEYGTLSIVITFISANVAGIIAIGVTQDTLPMIIDIAFATSIFVIIPSSIWSKLLSSIGFSSSTVEIMAQTASQKMMFASKTLIDVNSSISKVSKAMEKKMQERDLIFQVCENICSKCKNNMICWEKNNKEMLKSFNYIENILKLSGKISHTDFPKEISHCTKNILLEAEFNNLYNEINYNSQIKAKTKEMQIMMQDQFSAMAEMLDSLSNQMTGYTKADSFLSKEVLNFFVKKGLPQANVCVYYKAINSMAIEIYIPMKIKFDKKELCESISDIVEKDIDEPRYSTVGGLTRIEMWEKPCFCVDIGASQVAGKATEITGDSYEIFTDNDIESYVVLSDGMGSGKRAQLDSLLASSMISRLIRAGIGYSSAIRLLNGSLRVKGWEESFATIDISAINLCTGNMKLIKAGASATYLLRGEQVKKIEPSSLPIGIIQDVKPAVVEIALKANDIIITASDGLTENMLGTLQNIALSTNTVSAKELAKKMTKSAKQLSDENYCDDITIIITKILKNIN